MKFKILPKVNRFTDSKGVTHYPGEIVDLPARYQGFNWLEPVDKPKKVEVPPAKVEPAESVPETPAPFGSARKSKKAK